VWECSKYSQNPQAQQENIPVHAMPAPVVAVLPVIKRLKKVKIQIKRPAKVDEDRRQGHATDGRRRLQG
jgi:hypothetical protein